MTGTSAGLAQDVFVPSPVAPIYSDGYKSRQNLDGLAPIVGLWDWYTGAESVLQNLRYGPFEAHPHFYNQFVYGNGIAGSIGGSGDSYLNTFSPGVLFRYKNSWSLDYTPSMRFFGSGIFENTVNHSVVLTGAEKIGEWDTAFRTRTGISQDILAETQATTDIKSFDTSFQGARPLNSKLTLDGAVSHNYRDVSFGRPSDVTNRVAYSYHAYSVRGQLNYAVAPRISLGVGGDLGFIQSSDTRAISGAQNIDVVNESVFGRISWQPSDRLSFSLSSGLDFRQTLRHSGSSRNNPTLNATASYRPFDHTSIDAVASRSVGQGFFAGSQTYFTTYSLSLRQRFLGRYEFQGGVSRSDQEFQLNLPGVLASVPLSNFAVTSYRARLGTTVLKRFAVGVFFQYAEYDYSARLGFLARNFNTRQVGLDIGLRF